MTRTSDDRIDFYEQRSDALDALNELGHAVANARGLSDYAPAATHREACYLVSQGRTRVAHRVGVYLGLLRERHESDALDAPLSDLTDAERGLRRVVCGIDEGRDLEELVREVAAIGDRLRERRCLSCGDTCDVSDLRIDGTCVECERDTDSRTIPAQAVAS